MTEQAQEFEADVQVAPPEPIEETVQIDDVTLTLQKGKDGQPEFIINKEISRLYFDAKIMMQMSPKSKIPKQKAIETLNAYYHHLLRYNLKRCFQKILQ